MASPRSPQNGSARNGTTRNGAQKNGLLTAKNVSLTVLDVDAAHPEPAAAIRPKPRKSSSGGPDGFSLINLIARLIAWYALYTVLFRCPSYPTAESPAICHPAHTIKTALRPHVQPYYETYASPYVHRYSPYVQKVNREYIIPAYSSADKTYRQYGDPYVSTASKVAAAKYDKFLKPHVVTAQNKLQEYSSPYLEKAGEIWDKDVKPTIEVAEKKVKVFYEDKVRPNYEKAQPHLAAAYEKGKYVVTKIVAPLVKEGSEKVLGWGRTLWSDVVRPQVGRIGERLGGNNGSGSVSASIFSSLSAARPSKESASSASLASIIASASASRASSSAAAGEETPKKITKDEAKEIIKNDLDTWTAKFSSTSIKTLADLKSQIDEISEKAYKNKREFVEKDIASLQKLVDGGFEELKAEISSLVKKLTPQSSADELSVAHEKLQAATRNLGTQIRDKAQQLRTESGEFLTKVYDEVSEAADQHLEILDGINDAGMQKLGMKWAWMDFVSYKDWAKYHELKNELKESRSTIIKSAEANEKLQEITNWVEDDWEGKATDIAKHAAEELKRLKNVFKKQIESVNAPDDLAEYHIPVVARKPGQQVLKSAGKIKAAVESEDTAKDKVEAVEDEKSKISEAVVGEPTESTASTVSEALESATSQVSEDIDSASSAVSESTARVKNKIPGGVEAGFVAAAEPIVYEEDGIVDDLKSRLAEASKAVSQAVHDALARETEPSVADSIQSRAKELHESALYAASSILYSTPTPVTEQMFSIATDKYSAAVAAASSIIHGTPTPTHEVLMSQAKEAYTQATAAALDSFRSAKRLAVTKVQPEEQAAKESLYSVASENYKSGLSAAAASYSSVISAGSEMRKSYESAVADARSRFDEAAAKASTMIYGTPQPAAESVLSVAHEQYQHAMADAKKSYDSWFQAASTQLYGTPTPAIESVFSSAASAFSTAAEDAASAASTMVYGTPSPTGASASASSLASEAAASLSSATDIAAHRYTELSSILAELIHEKPPTFSQSVMARFSSAYYGTPTPTPLLSQVSSAAQAVASMPPAIDEMIHDAVSRVKEFAAEKVYGKEPTAWEGYREQLRKLGEEAVEGVSAAIYGTATTPKSGLEAAKESAASLVSEATQAVGEAAEYAKEAAHDAAEKLGWIEEEKSYKDQLVENARKRILAAVEAAEEALRTAKKKAEKVRDEL